MYVLQAILTCLLYPVTLGSSGPMGGFGRPCNKILTATDTPRNIMSPGYPNKYARNTACLWTIKTKDSDKRVVVETVDFQLYKTTECNTDSADSLLVYNDINSANNSTLYLCNEDRKMITSEGQSLYLVFTSDSAHETRGFKLRYYQASARTPCNRELESTRFLYDYIRSPGYPGGYFSNLECNYTIRTNIPGDRVEIVLLDSDIEDSTHCQYDSLIVVDQNNGTEMTLGTVCGRNKPTFRSSGNTLQLRFTSNKVKVNTGFRIRYTSVPTWDCSFNTEATRTESFLMSPGYPIQYYSNLTCDWGIFYHDANRTIDITIIKSNISGIGPNCTGDKAEVSDYHANSTSTVFCGTETPQFHMKYFTWVSFFTDGQSEAQGFILKYHLQQENITLSPCGGTLNADSNEQILQSPLYPDTPLMNQTCVWTVTTTHGDGIIVISLMDLDVEMDSNCAFDSLHLYDANSAADGKTLVKWCGQRGGEITYSTGSSLTIVYKVDDSNNGRGFQLKYSTRNASSTHYTSQLTTKQRVSYLSSPGFSYYFPQNKHVSYVFTADVGYQVHVEVTQSRLLPGILGICRNIYGRFYDGVTPSDPVLVSINTHIFTWCGRDNPVYVSSGNHMLLDYHTGSAGSKNIGFKLRYTQGHYYSTHIIRCGGVVEANSTHKNITSPNYPISYFNNIDCRWVIQAATNGSMVRVVINDFSTEGDFTTGCSRHDTLTFYNGSETDSNKLETWCGGLMSSVQSTGDVLTAVFHTDRSTTKRGFSLQVFETTESLPCEMHLTVTSTSSHTWTPGLYQHKLAPNTTCTWTFTREYSSRYIHLTVKAPPGGNISSDACAANYLNVYDGRSESSPLIGRFCGGDEQKYIGAGDHMFVKMVSGPEPLVEGFDIDFVTATDSICGNDDLTAYKSDSVLVSPYFPHQYPENLDCMWYISTTDLDYIIVLEVITSDVDDTEGCGKDYLVAYDGYGTTASPINRWCGSETPTYESTGQFMSIKFHTDNTGSNTGFKLKYRTKYHPFTLDYQQVDVAAIVGGTLGGVAFFVIILVIIAACFARRPSRRPILVTTSPSYAQPGQVQNTQTQNMHVYNNHAYGGSSTTTPSVLTGSRSGYTAPENASTGAITHKHYENVNSGSH